MQPIYLDHAATTPIDPRVRKGMAPFLEAEFGNPSSRHAVGIRAAEALDSARARIARAVGGADRDVLLTSGGTEANNLAVLGAARIRGGGNLVIGSTEHPCVRASAAALSEEGFEVREMSLDAEGGLDLDSAAALLDEDTVLVSQMLVNNEFGTHYPVRELARMTRRLAPRAHVHTDAVQGLGKVEIDIEELGVDSLAISAHKVHAPKGTGALVTRGQVRLRPLVFGGGQQEGLRPGTENVAGAVGFGLAAEFADSELEGTRLATARARSRLLEGLSRVPGSRPVEPGCERVDAICAVLLPGAPAEVWQHHLEARGVYTSVGSACQSNDKEVSPALRALGLDAETARHVMRFSFSGWTKIEEIDAALEAVAGVAPALEALR